MAVGQMRLIDSDLKTAQHNLSTRTCLACLKAGGSCSVSESMLAQCEVPGIKMATSSDVWFVSTLSACQGSIEPAQNGFGKR